jgi:D-alanine-D-alanine ligase
MKIALLSNIFNNSVGYTEVEDDLIEVGRLVKNALVENGHEVNIFDVNEKTFEKLRKAKADGRIDLAFNVCERFNGSSLLEPHVAAMLEMLSIPYTGSSHLTLAMCINKARVKEILIHHGIPTPNYQVFYSRNKKLNSSLRFPLIVKPASMDNSIGITNDSVVHSEKELRSKIAYILRTYNQPALVEEYIDGRDLNVGILGNGNSIINLPINEVLYDDDLPKEINKMFSYDAKWDVDSQIYNKRRYAEADLPKYLETKIKKIGADVYNILEVRDYGRVDIRLSKEGIPYVLEMNPNPGISCDCNIPQAAMLSGISYNEMIEKILNFALQRYGLKNDKIKGLDYADNKIPKLIEVKQTV